MPLIFDNAISQRGQHRSQEKQNYDNANTDSKGKSVKKQTGLRASAGPTKQSFHS